MIYNKLPLGVKWPIPSLHSMRNMISPFLYYLNVLDSVLAIELLTANLILIVSPILFQYHCWLMMHLQVMYSLHVTTDGEIENAIPIRVLAMNNIFQSDDEVDFVVAFGAVANAVILVKEFD